MCLLGLIPLFRRSILATRRTKIMPEQKKDASIEERTGLPREKQAEMFSSTASAIFVAGIDNRARSQISANEAVDMAISLIGEALSKGALLELEKASQDPKAYEHFYIRALNNANKRIKDHAEADQKAEIAAINLLTSTPPKIG
ncbi:MAG: hypothetical protein WDN02_16840 [Methylovirgula sp.]|uniref:hypothetical protein n=1 Tax=Methylovirgula sp. TaxID=1978224 RepID=UPI0030765ED6